MAKLITVTAKFKVPKGTKYNPKALKEGMKVEAEHSPSKKVQKLIAQNHLDEDANYYKKLKKSKL